MTPPKKSIEKSSPSTDDSLDATPYALYPGRPAPCLERHSSANSRTTAGALSRYKTNRHNYLTNLTIKTN